MDKKEKKVLDEILDQSDDFKELMIILKDSINKSIENNKTLTLFEGNVQKYRGHSLNDFNKNNKICFRKETLKEEIMRNVNSFLDNIGFEPQPLLKINSSKINKYLPKECKIYKTVNGTYIFHNNSIHPDSLYIITVNPREFSTYNIKAFSKAITQLRKIDKQEKIEYIKGIKRIDSKIKIECLYKEFNLPRTPQKKIKNRKDMENAKRRKMHIYQRWGEISKRFNPNNPINSYRNKAIIKETIFKELKNTQFECSKRTIRQYTQYY